MTYDLEQRIDRRHTESLKWNHYDEDVLPLWVADMDFRSPEPVIQTLHERVEHGVFGYGSDPPELRGVVVDRLQRLYGWDVSPAALVFLPGLEPPSIWSAMPWALAGMVCCCSRRSIPRCYPPQAAQGSPTTRWN